MKACRDCRHVLIEHDRAICGHPTAAKWFPDYYTGGEILERPSIQVARTIGECRPEAQLFEAKPCS